MAINQFECSTVNQFLAARQISVSVAERARILKERKFATFDRWFDCALSVRTTAELF